MVELKSVCHFIIDGDWIESKDQSSQGIRLVQTGNIGIGEYLDKSSRAKYISNETFMRLNCTEIFPGDILISRLPDPVGRACVVPQYVGRAITAVDCTIVRLNTSLCDPKYFINYTQSERYANELSKFLAGTTRTRISRKNLEKIQIPLPPLDEQCKIAAVLDKVSDLIAKRRQQLTKLDELVKARFMEMFGKLEFNNNATTIEEISEMVTVGIANSATHAYAAEGIVLLRNQNIRENYLDDSDLVYITPAFADKYRTKALKENDILVTRTGYPGIACLVPKKYIGCQTFTTLILRLKESIAILPSFVCHYINSNYGKSFVEEMKVGVAQQNFGAKALGKMPIFVPPIEKQVEFVTFIDEIEKIKVSTSHSLDKLETLKNALMQEYFG